MRKTFIQMLEGMEIQEGGPDPSTLGDFEVMKAKKDKAYEERNRLVALVGRMALSMGMNVGITKTDIEGWDPEWHHCIYIDLPTGQVSWHYHDEHAQMFYGFPPYSGAWDGHDTSEKYRRVDAAFV